MPNKFVPRNPNVALSSKKELSQLVRPYSDEELSGDNVDEKIKKLMEFFDQTGINYDKFKEDFLDSKAYPNYDQYSYLPGQHDIKKWMMALKNIQYKQKAGLPYREAIRQSTTDWKKMEIYDFLNWLRFYEEGAQMKYKFAQVWYENGQPGYFLHIKKDPVPEAAPIVDENSVNEARENAERTEEKKQTIEKQRAKIIGRLDSAEKLLRSPDGQMFAGPEMENLMEAIYSLKKKVQLVNKISTSTRLYEDMIVREANVLNRRGFVKAADMLYSLAQSPGQSAVGATGTGQVDAGAIPPTPPPDPSGAGQSGTMSGLPSTAPGVPNVNSPSDTAGAGTQNDQPSTKSLMGAGNAPTGTAESTPAIIPQEPPQPKGIKDFIENMNEDAPDEDGNKADDNLEVYDQLHVDDAEEELMVTEAQVASPVPGPAIPPAALEDIPITDAPAPVRGKPANLPPPSPDVILPEVDAPKTPKSPKGDSGPLEVTEDDIPKNDAATPDSGFNDKVDQLMQNVTIADVVGELEDISKDYKTRRQPRRLGYVDMMLDSLGLASMFPSLSEAQNKALEANNYISTRVDDILSKLRGAMASQETEPSGTQNEKPEVAGIKGKLQNDQDKEAKRKQMRKEQEAAELEGGAGKEAPQVEMEELAPPPTAPAAKGPPVPPRPLG